MSYPATGTASSRKPAARPAGVIAKSGQLVAKAENLSQENPIPVIRLPSLSSWRSSDHP